MATGNNSEQAVKKHKFEDKLKAKKDLFNKELKILGSSDVKTLATENEIALLHLQAYQYDKALLYFKEVYYKRLSILGSNNLDTIDTQSNIGIIYRRQDRPDEALNIFHDVYRKRCDILGYKHPDTQESIRNIGLILQKQKKYVEAFEIFNKLEDGINCQETMARTLSDENNCEKALEIYTKIKEKVLEIFGPDAPETLTAKYHIGEVLAKLSRWEEVLPIYEEVLKWRKRSLGPFHKYTVSALNDYGVALYKLGNIEEGLDVLHETYQKAKIALGPENESSLRVQSDIGFILKSEGRYYESLQVYYDILRILTNENPDQSEALKIKLMIANIYTEQGNGSEVYKIYSKVYKSLKKSSLWKKTASLLMKQGKGVEIVKIHREWYEGKNETLGPEDPRTLCAYESLGEVHLYLKECSEAFEVFSNVFSRRKVVLGIDHTDTLRTRQRMADVLAMQHDYAEATLVYKEVYKVRKALPFSKYTYYVVTNLAGLLCLQEEYEESLSAYEERASMSLEMYDGDQTADVEKNIVHIVLKNDIEIEAVLHTFKKLSEKMASIRSPEHPSTIEIHNAFAEILHEQKMYDEALKVYEKVYHLQKTLSSSSAGDPAIHTAKYNVGNMYFCLGKFDEAVEVLEDVYTNLKLSLAPEHSKLLDTQLQFAEALYNANQLDAAVSHCLEIYWKTKRKLGLNHRIISKCEQCITAIRIKLPKSKLAEKIMDCDFHSFLTCLEEEKGSVNDQDATGAAPLHYASQRGHVDFVKSLLKSGAFYDLKDKFGKKPIDYALVEDIVSMLLTVNNFFISAKVGNDESVTKLITNGSLIDAKDKDGNTGLHQASRGGHINIVKMLVECGADWSLKNEKNEVPIDVAISTGNAEIADFLRKLSKTDNYRLSKLINESGGNTPLHLSARKGHLEILLELLRCGADPADANDRGYTPLHFAAYEGNSAVTEALLKFMKTTNAKKLKNFISCKNSVDGATALEIASERGFAEITKVLVNYEADEVHS